MREIRRGFGSGLGSRLLPGCGGSFDALHCDTHPPEWGVADFGRDAEVFSEQRPEVFAVDKDEGFFFRPELRAPFNDEFLR